MTIAAVLLAAGRSSRFGEADKLTAPFDGRPLAEHAARALAALPVSPRIAVVKSAAFGWEGFERVVNDDPDAGMSRSLRLGVEAAHGAQAILVALADMPRVPLAHYRRLLERYRGPSTLVASSDGARAMSPALFGAQWFDSLGASTGDKGARGLLTRAELIRASAADLIDIDTFEDLAGSRSPLAQR